MLFDTDVLIWIFRGNEKAARVVDKTTDRHLSIVTYMELLQGARDRQELRMIRAFLAEFGFRMLPLTENIGHRAAIYLEEYVLKTALSMGDALVAAAAVENRLTLCTANRKHYKVIGDLDTRVIRP